MASLSTWADEPKNRATASWHYVNFPKGTCVYEAERDCPEGQCAVEAIDRQRAVLGSSAPDEKRLEALKYVVHLVGDLHQPLHAGYAEDKGGNQYQLQAFMQGSNLHALWDSGLIRNLNEDAGAMTTRLLAQRLPGQATEVSAARIAEDDRFLPGKKGRCGLRRAVHACDGAAPAVGRGTLGQAAEPGAPVTS
jgi:hypothetical protein